MLTFNYPQDTLRFVRTGLGIDRTVHVSNCWLSCQYQCRTTEVGRDFCVWFDKYVLLYSYLLAANGVCDRLWFCVV